MSNDTEWIGQTDRQRLIALFDAAYECRCDLVIWEHDEAAAPEAIGAWAAGRDIALVAKKIDLSLSDAVMTVQRPGIARGRIEVYCKRGVVAQAVAS